jgi:hypothetical protein
MFNPLYMARMHKLQTMFPSDFSTQRSMLHTLADTKKYKHQKFEKKSASYEYIALYIGLGNISW